MTSFPAWIAALAAVLSLGACTQDDPPPAQAAEETPTEVELLRARLEANPRDTDALMHLADQYERAQVFDEEAATLEKLLAIAPDDAYAHFKLGTTCNRLGRWADAVAHFGRAAKTRLGKQPVLHNNLAFAYGKLGKRREEIAALEKAIALRPRYAVARFNLGVALLHEGQRARALEQVAALRDFDEGAAASLEKVIDAQPR